MKIKRIISGAMAMIMLLTLFPFTQIAYAEETNSFDVDGSKTASPTELTREARDTTVTLKLPSGEYENKIDIVFVMDNSTSTKNSGIDFSETVADLLDSIVENNEGVDLKIGVVKFRGYATNTLGDGLVKYDSSTSETIKNAVANNSVPGKGSNGHSGLVMAEQLLSADEEVENDHKYVVFLTDGKNYIWNNSENKPVTIYQQARKSGAIQNGGKPRLNQYDGITQKENGAYPSIYNSIPQITDHETLIFSKDLNINLYDSAYYTNLYNSTHEDLTGETKYDFPAYYTTYYPESSYSGTVASGDGTVVTHPIANAGTDVVPTPAFYKTYYEYTPQDGTFWKDVNYLQTNPYIVVLNEEDGKYYYDTEQVNEDFFLWHATALEKGPYVLGHYWKETIDAKYNTGAIVFYDPGSGTGSHITQSFDQWLVENSDYGAWMDDSARVLDLFDNIDRAVRYMVGSGVVTDVIPSEFTLKNADAAEGFSMTKSDEPLSVTFADGKWNFGTANDQGVYPYVVEYDDSTKTITWTMNVPVENLNPITLSYDLTLDESAEVGSHDTNVSAVLSYKSTDGKKDGTFTFEIPKVNYTKTATYMVEHYKQNRDDDEYTIVAGDTEVKDGNVGDETRAEANTYEGFKAKDFNQEIIKDDNSTKVKIYYDREKYKVTYRYLDPVPDGASRLPAEATYKYGAIVTVAPDGEASGYTFNGWSRKGTFEMPAEDVEITGSFTKKETPPPPPVTPDGPPNTGDDRQFAKAFTAMAVSGVALVALGAYIVIKKRRDREVK